MNIKFAELSGLATILIALASVVIYIDNKYVDTDEFAEVVGLIATTMYDRRINDLTQTLKYEYNHKPKNLEYIKYLEGRIEFVKKNREKFLESGHLPIGDAITVNRGALKKVLID